MSEGFIFYRSWAKGLEDLPPKEYKACMQALIDYAINGEEKPTTANAKMFLSMAKPYIDKNNQRRANGMKGGRPKTEHEPKETEPKPNDNQTEPKAEKTKGTVTVTVTETVTDIYKNKERPSARFVKPTVEDIRAYCLERRNSVDPQTFYDFYESKGWMVGKSPMKDWKATVRTWESRRKEEARAPAKRNQFNDNFEARKYDFDDLETQLLRAQGR